MRNFCFTPRQNLVTRGVFTAIIGLSAAAAVLLAGCSSPPTPEPAAAATQSVSGPAAAAGNPPAVAAAGAASNTDPCSLLTQSEVEAAAGQPLGKGNRVMSNNCLWSTPDFATGVSLTFGGWADYQFSLKMRKKEPTPVSGFGDEAWVRHDPPGLDLCVRKGSNGFSVDTTGRRVDGKPDLQLAQDKILAAAVLSRL